MSGKQRRGHDPSKTWRQTKAAQDARQYNGQFRDHEKRREAIDTVTGQVFEKIEVHAKGFEGCSSAGFTGELQTKAAENADKLLKVWRAVRESPKNVPKNYEEIDQLVWKYLESLLNFAELEKDAVDEFLKSVQPYYKYSGSEDWRRVRTDQFGFIPMDVSLIRVFWLLFFNPSSLISDIEIPDIEIPDIH